MGGFIMDYVLSCCSPADLTQEQFDRRNIRYICFHYELDGVQYPDDLGQTIPFEQFYAAMAAGSDTKTSQVNVDEFIDYFTPMLEAGQDILHVTLSSGISGVYNSANAAREELSARYPDRKIYVLDSLAASGGYGLLMDALADQRDGGMDIDALYAWGLANRLKVHHWFFTSDLTFFIRGGRVSKVPGYIGTMLGICPLLNVDYLGRLIPRFKVRGKKSVISKCVDQMVIHVDNGTDYDGYCYINHSHCYDDAKAVADLVEKKFHNLKGRILINSIGTVIGSHTGPGTVALFFTGDKRID